jgi:hypothetical protein
VRMEYQSSRRADLLPAGGTRGRLSPRFNQSRVKPGQAKGSYLEIFDLEVPRLLSARVEIVSWIWLALLNSLDLETELPQSIFVTRSKSSNLRVQLMKVDSRSTNHHMLHDISTNSFDLPYRES